MTKLHFHHRIIIGAVLSIFSLHTFAFRLISEETQITSGFAGHVTKGDYISGKISNLSNNQHPFIVKAKTSDTSGYIQSNLSAHSNHVYCFHNQSNEVLQSSYVIGLKVGDINAISIDAKFELSPNEYFCTNKLAIDLIADTSRSGTFKTLAYTQGVAGSLIKNAEDSATVTVYDHV